MPRKTNVYLAAAATTAALLAGGCGGNGAAGSVGDAAGRVARISATERASAGTRTGTGTGVEAGVGTGVEAGTGVSTGTGTGTGVSTGVGTGVEAGPAASRAEPAAMPTIDPGTLPQTNALPGDRDARFLAGAQDLWQAIVQDKPELARPFFFPLSAYRQVKAIWNPAEDYQDRLVAWYGLDIRAAHDHLGSAAGARFVGVDVPVGDAEWIEPGAEYNKGSYYRVYGTRLNYQVDGHDASIGVFSLISWRGEWYVVHLGPSIRSAMEGIVYDPWN